MLSTMPEPRMRPCRWFCGPPPSGVRAPHRRDQSPPPPGSAPPLHRRGQSAPPPGSYSPTSRDGSRRHPRWPKHKARQEPHLQLLRGSSPQEPLCHLKEGTKAALRVSNRVKSHWQLAHPSLETPQGGKNSSVRMWPTWICSRKHSGPWNFLPRDPDVWGNPHTTRLHYLYDHP